MEKKKYPAVNIGSASMLVIFIILCLVTFSVLSVASANSDRIYAQNIAGRTTQYYEACNKAEAQLAEIDQMLAGIYSEYGDLSLTQLTSVPDFSNLKYPADTSAFPELSFSVPLNDSQELFVTLRIRTPSESGDTFYTITCWKEISTEDWSLDEPMNLM